MDQRAGDGTRTRDPELGKLVLYQLSYSRNVPNEPNAQSYGRGVPPSRRPAVLRENSIRLDYRGFLSRSRQDVCSMT